MWELIKELVKGGTTLLLTTQYLEEADELAERIAVIDDGRVIAEGTADELKSDLASDFLELRVQDASQINRAVDALRSFGEAKVDKETGRLTLPVSDGAQSLIRAVRSLDEADIKLEDLSLRRPSLDDVFLSLTGQAKQEANRSNP